MKAFGYLAIIAYFCISGLTTASAQWSEPVNVGPPVNSTLDERRPSLTTFSDMMVLKTGRGDSSGLFTTRYVDGQWTELEYVYSVGNPANIKPALSPDGSEIYFSCYCGGYGDYDIWRVVYDSVRGTWTDPVNAGPNINDEGGQTAPFLSYDGQKLYFIDHSNRFPNGLVVSHRIDDEWSNPEWVNNYFAPAENASLTMDENQMYFGKAIPNEYWAVFFSQKDDNGYWMPPERFDEINDYGRAVYPKVNADGSRVYFSSENMGGEGGSDIWYVERPTAVFDTEYKNEKHLISVYPNPSNIFFNIRINEDIRVDGNIIIYDILGRQISQIPVSSKEMVIPWPSREGLGEDLSNGIYFLKWFGKGGDAIDTKKLVLLK
ncbi:MAG: T9SS type A sorting domain-containing protein [candidate division Zixibacteria bacterium]